MSSVVIIGPHRSGTTFVARCIAHDRGCEFIPEERIKFSNKYLMSCFLRDDTQRVIQAPWLAAYIHQFVEWQPEVIWVNRPDAEIYASQRRMFDKDGNKVHWILQDRQLRKQYNLEVGEDVLQAQRETWQVQKPRFQNASEVNYHDFDEHPLHRDNREQYHFRQIEGDPIMVPKRQRSGEIVAF